ncbi:hypothetical protein ACWCP6_19570 [Streptomyces sp. NPDC002004]
MFPSACPLEANTEGRLAGEPNIGHTKEVFAVRVIELEVRPVVISAGRDRVARVWELTGV